MFFLLSKLLYHLMMPFTVVSLLFILSVLIRNPQWKKRFFWGAFSLLMIFSNLFLANEVMRAWEVDAIPYDKLKRYKLGIVLTGATIPNLKPNDRVYFHRGADRVVHAVQLYKLKLIDKILISGGSGQLTGEEQPEANKFQSVMLLMGVPQEDILIENVTRNTAESAIEVKKMLAAFGYNNTDCLLITSAFHMRRSLAVYAKAGLELDSFGTDYYAEPRNFFPDTLLIPQIDAVVMWHKLVKEWIGIIAYKIVGYA